MSKTVVRSIATIGTLHLLGWGLFAVALYSTQSTAGASLAIGAGLAAYGLGARHAFDADHIAAIDNTTRMLRARGQSPTTVGLWFSLGHSTVVLVGCVLLGVGWKTVADQMGGETSTIIGEYAGVWGAIVSSVFLIVLGVLNLIVIKHLLSAHRAGNVERVEQVLTQRGFLSAIFGSRFTLVTRPRHMFVVGLLLGLGFDTAISVGLLLLASGVAVGVLPWYSFIALPLIFSASMSLFDSLDGFAMNYAYAWADGSTKRRLGYNVFVTSVSIAVAFFIGAVNLAGVAYNQGITQFERIASVNLDVLGFTLVGFFMTVWVAAILAAKQANPAPI